MTSTHSADSNSMFRRKAPSLLELCIQTTIDNVRYIGDVGETDIELLKDILPHCTIDQLMHIEKSSQGRDLSPATDHLWKKYYERQFGPDSSKLVIERMKQKNVSFRWRKLYEAKLKEIEQVQKDSVDRFKQRYAKEDSKKKSRQIKICTKLPSSSSKRSSFRGNGASNNFPHLKSNLMKKAKMETLNSHEARAHAAMKKNALQRKVSVRQTTTTITTTRPIGFQPNGFPGRGSASSSKLSMPSRKLFP
ncbi:hypothetical protein GIB67_000526 [Kingdonia uniflora]|uniref:Elongin-A n=1 Tax=Kingdonia uniflora TaxID=39325 RepID=A0A7J7MIJ7_9MAGN|nr:hypothetical protein GIB67_000526 [Kingdonia uniflora]